MAIVELKELERELSGAPSPFLPRHGSYLTYL